MAYLFEKFAAHNEIPIYQKSTGKKIVNRLLMGTWMGVLEESQDRYRISTAGPDGWVMKTDSTDHRHLKVFYIDVGQGDGTLIEVGDLRYIIDGGPNENMFNYLRAWQYKYLLQSNQEVNIEGLFVSHFDADHYFGLSHLIKDTRFTINTVYHNGIARFHSTKSKRPAGHDSDLGKTKQSGEERYLASKFDDLDDLRALVSSGGLQRGFKRWAEAVLDAADAGRIGRLKSLTHKHGALIDRQVNNLPLRFDILGPVPSKVGNRNMFKWFKDSSHTRNGHSVVIKLTYGERSMLFGGDLNTPAEQHLMQHYGDENPFKVDVAKCCHHGSSDFTVDFLKQVNPFATVISSGDNESYAHPRADTVGCAGKYSRGKRPKVYSTELARSINSAGKVLYGMINLRSDGDRVFMSQMKESRRSADIWDSYTIK